MRTSALFVCVLTCSAAPALAQSATLAFSNQTAAAGIDVKYNPGSFSQSEYMGGGTCGDFDRDGDEDLFILSGGGSNGPDRLYINQGNGTFLEQSAQWGLTSVHRGIGSAVGDYDGDGYLDIYETSNGVSGAAQAGQNKLYRNLGGAAFVNVAAAAGVTGAAIDSFGASFGDYDLDGDLDLLVPGFDSHKTRLYRNQGDGTFTDVTASSQLAGNIANVYAFATRFADMDGDRYPEIIIAGDFGTSRFFRNNANSTFSNYTFQSGTGKDENGMGQTVGDFNRDGRPDIYLASIYSTSISNWTGNKLYQNQGANVFSEISQAAGVDDGGYGWGSVAIDFNHDRWLDIAETNGAQWSQEWVGERSYLWLNQGNGTFTEVSQSVGFNDFDQGRGMLNLDYDLDGDEDIVVFGNDEKAKLWRNDLSGTDIHWLRVRLDTNADPGLAQDGVGSVVRVTALGVQQTGYLFGGDNLQGQSELRVHFGLGAVTTIDELKVEWNDGRITTLNNVAVDQNLTITPAWTSVGGGIAGLAGPVSLTGQGTLMSGATTNISVAGAVANASGSLFVGLATLNKPLFGGTFVPVPTFQIPVVASGTGTFSLIAPWPAGLPSSFPIWFQAWFPAGGGPLGPSASNGLKAVTP